MYVANRTDDAVCDHVGTTEDDRLYFDIIPRTNDTVCLAARGSDQTWYLASDGKNRIFFQPEEGTNTLFNVVEMWVDDPIFSRPPILNGISTALHRRDPFRLRFAAT
jgi:hypothetical protein